MTDPATIGALTSLIVALGEFAYPELSRRRPLEERRRIAAQVLLDDTRRGPERKEGDSE